jgi:adenylate kinase
VVVDVSALKARLRSLKGPGVIYGHLLPEAAPPSVLQKVVVLRTEPSVLKSRLESRGYVREKVVENVEAELIGLVAAEAFTAFGVTKTFEVDTTSTTPGEACTLVLEGIRGSRGGARRLDWTRSYDRGEKLRSLLTLS